MKPADVPVSTIELVVPLLPPEMTRFPVAPEARAASDVNVRLLVPLPAQVDWTVPSPDENVNANMPWATPTASLQLNVPVPVKVRAVPVVPFKLPVTVRVPATIVVVPV